jgi:hypothetical protein
MDLLRERHQLMAFAQYLFRITIAWWQLVTGVSYTLLEFPAPAL